jgi:hypothetical protein
VAININHNLMITQMLKIKHQFHLINLIMNTQRQMIQPNSIHIEMKDYQVHRDLVMNDMKVGKRKIDVRTNPICLNQF